MRKTRRRTRGGRPGRQGRKTRGLATGGSGTPTRRGGAGRERQASRGRGAARAARGAAAQGERVASSIVQALRGGGWVSGSALGAAHGMSRAAIGKHVATLRRMGFCIDASPRLGYHLAAVPDLVCPALLEPLLRGRFGRECRYLERTGSTNDDAVAWARAGAIEGSLVVAEEQTRGRGRMARAWHSPPSENLYFSLVLRPPLPPQLVPPLTLAAGVAIFDLLKDRGFAPELKWPNDVLLSGKKVAGVLTEMSSEPERLVHVVLGVGLNVNTCAFPDEIAHRATSLRLASGPGAPPIPRAPLLADLLQGLEARYVEFVRHGPASIIRAFRERWTGVGRTVRVRAGGTLVAGVAVDIDESGALVVERRGRTERLLSGEILLWDDVGAAS